jgi:hypothetical protein
MKHLRLIQGRSYATLDGKIKASEQKPDFYTEDEAIAAFAVASGYFKLIGDEDGASSGGKNSQEVAGKSATTSIGYGGKTLQEMNKSELETYAAYSDVDIKGMKTKSEIIAKLKESIEGLEDDTIVNYGSPTMTELQKEIVPEG